MKVLRVMVGMVKNKKLPPYADGSLYFIAVEKSPCPL